MSSTFLHADLAALLVRLGFHEDPSSFHGALCGALCRVAPEQLRAEQLLDEPAAPLDAHGRDELEDVLEQTLESLGDAELGFMPLLPDDEAGLDERAQALGAWCEGFLYGLAAQTRLELEGCSDEVREIVRDLSELSRAGLGDAEDMEVEESAYAELVEYVRIGVQLIYTELRPRLHGDDDSAPTIH